ncbi:LLM class flavin-dependent oxidoreductase [Cohnella massiliensis]|uniref:LLM class flavin-dependent oxidoreductase n=1 Tax=Cohnella massiliensis TaxID=1816691 RepID=UPI0009B9FFDF|nr:LLM class flavin-dependent oxidoreductase [Cohnella massiliensis]
MADVERKLHLSVTLGGPGHHPGAWRASGSVPEEWFSLDFYRRQALLAEEGKFDLLLVDDLPGLGQRARFGAAATSGETGASLARAIRPEAVSTVSALVPFARKIGLAATVPVTYNEPYHVARKFASLDHLTRGRAAWTIALNETDGAIRHYGPNPAKTAEEKEWQAREFADVVKALWDSWEDGALIVDKESGVYADPAKYHKLRHRGRFYTVHGALNVSHPPQGHPLIVGNADAAPGFEFAADHADLILAHRATFEEARELRERAVKVRSATRWLPSAPKVLLNVMPVLGATEAEAAEQAQTLERLAMEIGGTAVSGEGEAAPGLGAVGAAEPAAAANLSGAAGLGVGVKYWTLVGSYEQAAEKLAEWFEAGACDGFNLLPAVLPEGLGEFVREVVPRLQARGLFRTEYEESTLRERFGFFEPANRFERERDKTVRA